MAADLLLVDGNPLDDICLLMSPPRSGAVMHADAVAALGGGGGGGEAPGGREPRPLGAGELAGLVEGVRSACARAVGGGSAIRLVVREGLLAVVPSLELLDANRRLYAST
jgi:hypothetical protein